MIPGQIGLAMLAAAALLSIAIYATSPLSESVFRPKRGRKVFKGSGEEAQSIRRNHQPLRQETLPRLAAGRTSGTRFTGQ